MGRVIANFPASPVLMHRARRRGSLESLLVDGASVSLTFWLYIPNEKAATKKKKSVQMDEIT